MKLKINSEDCIIVIFTSRGTKVFPESKIHSILNGKIKLICIWKYVFRVGRLLTCLLSIITVVEDAKSHVPI